MCASTTHTLLMPYFSKCVWMHTNSWCSSHSLLPWTGSLSLTSAATMVRRLNIFSHIFFLLSNFQTRPYFVSSSIFLWCIRVPEFSRCITVHLHTMIHLRRFCLDVPITVLGYWLHSPWCISLLMHAFRQVTHARAHSPTRTWVWLWTDLTCLQIWWTNIKLHVFPLSPSFFISFSLSLPLPLLLLFLTGDADTNQHV